MKNKSEKIIKKLKNGKISKDDIKIYLTPLGKIVAAGELALREREKKLRFLKKDITKRCGIKEKELFGKIER